MPWGIPVPDDDDHVLFVWFDALSNYITALGWPDDKKFEEFWPGTQVAGKDNLRQQTAMWQAMLMSVGLPPSKQILIHGFINVDGQKMSKSLGNVVDPFELVEKYGVDATRYYLLREISPFQDGDFTYEKFEGRYNADLSKGVGNLVSRITKMASDVFDERAQYRADPEFEVLFEEITTQVNNFTDSYQFNDALSSVWQLVAHCDRYIEKERPWETKDKKVLRNLLASLAQIAFFLAPFLPDTSNKILHRLGAQENEPWSFQVEDTQDPLFPRI